MKKSFLATAFLFLLLMSSYAEIKTLGLRFANPGYNSGTGAEVTFQSTMGKANRLELDLGAYSQSFSLAAILQWKWNLNQIGPGFAWYAGGGLSAGSYYGNNIGLGILGQIGIEYNFNIPLQISLDFRPSWNSYYSYYNGTGLSVRYRF
jgi:hypothetical protein